MEDAASEISDWEVLSAVSGSGAGDDDNEVLIVSGGGGDVLHDHFALAPNPDPDPDPHPAAAEFPAVGPWSDPGLELVDGFDPALRATFDFVAGVSIERPPIGGGSEAREEGSVLEDTLARGASWSVNVDEAVDAEIERETNAAINRDELRLVLQPALHVVGETLDSDAAKPAGASLKIEAPESPHVQLDDLEIGEGIENSCPEDAASSDVIHGGQEEQEQGSNTDAASRCDEPDEEAKDAASPGAEEGDKQVAVWWRLPFRLLHFCAWKVKPVWSFSIAAALLGLVVLGRRMYRMKRQAKGLPQIKIAFDDKRASQFADRAGRLNEAFLIARRVPLLRTSSGAILPWSMVQER